MNDSNLALTAKQRLSNVLKKSWFIPVLSALLIDSHTRFWLLEVDGSVDNSLAGYVFIMAAVALLSVPCIACLNFALETSTKTKMKRALVVIFLIYPPLLIALHSQDAVPVQFQLLTEHFTEQTWLFVLAAGIVAYFKNNPQTLPYHTPAKKWFGLLLSLDHVCVLLSVLWALVFAAVFAPYDNPLMHQPISFVIDTDSVSQNLTNFLSYFIQLLFIASLWLSVFFINRYLLIRKILGSHGVIYFVLSIACVIVVITPLYAAIMLMLPINAVPEGIQNLTPGGGQYLFDRQNYRVIFSILAISTPIILAFERQEQETQVSLIKQAQTETELKFLQQQVNPHFLFNTLNNLYALVLKKSEQAPDVIMQLANLLQYTVYEGQKEMVELSQEIDYLQNYWALQSIRLGNKATLEGTWPNTQDADDFKVPPLLLINILENAFKHGIEPSDETCFLRFSMALDAGQLIVDCRNSIPDGTSIESGGVGLTNLERRLYLLFGNNVSLKVDPSENEWKVHLTMTLERKELTND